MSSLAVGLELPRVAERAAPVAVTRMRVWAGRGAVVLATVLIVPFVLPVLLLSALLVIPLVPLLVWLSALALSAQAVGLEQESDEIDAVPAPGWTSELSRAH